MFRLETDFEDYYDKYSNINSNLTYNRFRNKGMSRGEALLYLNNNGVKTVKFGPFRKFGPQTDKLVVYTNPSQHDFLGKHIYTFNEVAGQYSNYTVAEFIGDYGGNTVKYLQVGARRFRLTFHNPEYKTKLKEGSMIAIEELPKQYNYAIGLPIFSIDYISNGVTMVAVDFNEVQRLDKIGMETLMTAEEVAMEVKSALIAYNKA